MERKWNSYCKGKIKLHKYMLIENEKMYDKDDFSRKKA